MDDFEKIKQRFELLKMARELLNDEYINKRAEDHNKWVAENEENWRTKHRSLPYPPFTEYPTDEEIVRTASNLYNFIYGQSPGNIGPEPIIETKSDDIPVGDTPHTQENELPQASIMPEVIHLHEIYEKPNRPPEIQQTEIKQDASAIESTESDIKESTIDSIHTPLEEIMLLRNKVDETDALTKLLVDGTITTELSKKELTTSMSNMKKLLPGWVRRSEN